MLPLVANLLPTTLNSKGFHIAARAERMWKLDEARATVDGDETVPARAG